MYISIFYLLFSYLSHQDKPNPPEDVEVTDLSADSCKLSWKPPAKDGGAPITGKTILCNVLCVTLLKIIFYIDDS